MQHPSDYPTYLWKNKKPDPNIDHRRCQNLAVFFRKYALSLTTEFDEKHFRDWQPGDVVFFVHKGQKHPWHVAIISDKKLESGIPLILHPFPPKASEASIADYGPIHSHFRWK